MPLLSLWVRHNSSKSRSPGESLQQWTEVPISVPAATDVDLARNGIVESVRRIDGVLGDPAPTVVVKSLDAARMNLLVYAWIADAETSFPSNSRSWKPQTPASKRPRNARQRLSQVAILGTPCSSHSAGEQG
jgi:small-conductance mechanosensitive channel